MNQYLVLTARDAKSMINMEIFEVDQQWMANLIEEDEMDYEIQDAENDWYRLGSHDPDCIDEE